MSRWKLRAPVVARTAWLMVAVIGCGPGISLDPRPETLSTPPMPAQASSPAAPSVPMPTAGAGRPGAGPPAPTGGPSLPRDWAVCGKLGGAGITAMVRDPTGAKVAVGHGSGVVTVHAASDWALLATIDADDETVIGLALSTGGDLLAVATEDVVRLFRSDGRELRGLQWSDDMYELAFAPDGAHLLGIDDVGYLTVWNVASGGVVTRPGPVLAASFTIDSRALVLVAEVAPAVRWLGLDGQELRRLSLPETLFAATLSRGARLLAAFGTGADQGGEEFYVMALGDGVPGPDDTVPAWKYATRISSGLINPAMVFSDDGARLVLLAENGLEVRNTDPGAGTPGEVLLTQPRAWLRFPTLSADGKTLLVASPGEQVTEIDLEDGLERRTFATLGGYPGPLSDLTASADGRHLASTSRGWQRGGPVWLWDLPARKPLRRFPGTGRFTTGAQFSPRGDLLAIFGDGAHLVRVDDGGVALRIAGEPDPHPPAFNGHGLAFPPDAQKGSLIRYATSAPSMTQMCESDLARTDASGYTEPRCWTIGSTHITGSGIDFSPDGGMVAVAGSWVTRTADNERLWKLPDVPHFPPPGGDLDGWVTFSRDGSLLLVASCPSEPRTCERPGAQVFRTADGTPIRTITGGRHAVFSADGTTVLAGDTLTDLATGSTRQRPVATELSAFLADQSIVTAEKSGRLRLLCPVP
jgi:WD40 repeat protein